MRYVHFMKQGSRDYFVVVVLRVVFSACWTVKRPPKKQKQNLCKQLQSIFWSARFQMILSSWVIANLAAASTSQVFRIFTHAQTNKCSYPDGSMNTSDEDLHKMGMYILVGWKSVYKCWTRASARSFVLSSNSDMTPWPNWTNWYPVCRIALTLCVLLHQNTDKFVRSSCLASSSPVSLSDPAVENTSLRRQDWARQRGKQPPRKFAFWHRLKRRREDLSSDVMVVMSQECM